MKKYVLNIFLFVLSIGVTFAQKGYSSASVSMNRANGILSPDQVIVEEYINYHTHQIPLPTHSEEVALSLDYNRVSENSYVVQIGMATQQLIDYSSIAPVNISLVIDRSGSMSGDKIRKVKKAILQFIKGLRPEDYISIIAYDSDAEVVLPSQKVKEVANLENIIESIEAGGSTNLCDGMVLGYKEAEKNRNPKGTNKVILLTDGLANVGITDSEKIVEKSFSYNQEGIDISTVGIGSDLDFTLLQQISSQGRGANYFVGNDNEDIAKAFDDELESLLSSVGKNVSLEISYPKGFKLNKVYGYQPNYDENVIKIPLKNINSGLTQVVLLEGNIEGEMIAPIEAVLNYTSVTSGKNKQLTKELVLQKDSKLSVKNEVLKNYYIGVMATSLKEMAKNVEDDKVKEGLTVLEKTLSEVDRVFPFLKDKDLLRVKEMLIKNKEKLETFIKAEDKN